MFILTQKYGNFIQKSHFDNSEFGMSMQADEVNPFFRSDVSPANEDPENTENSENSEAFDMERLLRSRGDVPSLPEDQKKLVIEDHKRQCPDLGKSYVTVQLHEIITATQFILRFCCKWKNKMW